MRLITTLASISLISLLAACGTPDDGYYDHNGNWIPNNPYHANNHARAPLPGGTADRDDDTYVSTYPGSSRRVVTTTTYSYDRPGYYNANGYYDTMEGGATVPRDMFPARGMCRVWFPSHVLADQPPVESCTGIENRVPSDAYVIYGG